MFARGFRELSGVGPAVTVFGSARTPPEHPHYAMTRELGAHLGRAGFAVITGGGGELMEAANRGAQDVGALSIGCNIELRHEQRLNPSVDIGLRFRHFFVRKFTFVRYACAFVICPAGGPAAVCAIVRRAFERQRDEALQRRGQSGER